MRCFVAAAGRGSAVFTAASLQMRRIDGTLQGIAAKNRALLRRDARQNRDLDELRERVAALEAKP